MTRAAGRAFGCARVRALRSRLLTRAHVLAPARTTGVCVPPPAARVADLVGWYRRLPPAFPDARPLLVAILRLHEVENLELAWRAACHRRSVPTVRRLWWDLGALGSLRAPDPGVTFDVADLLSRTRGTPYADIASALHRAHGPDLSAIELGLDRWAGARIVDGALALPSAEHAARALALWLVRERDLRLLQRGAPRFHLAPDLVAAATAFLQSEVPRARLTDLAAWTPAAGRPLVAALPPTVARVAPGALAWEDVLLAVRRHRHALCRRAFLGAPFTLAEPIALLLLKEAEEEGLRALAEVRRPEDVETAPVRRALAPGALEG